MPSVLWDERKVAPDRGRKTLNKRRKTHRERESNQVSLKERLQFPSSCFHSGPLCCGPVQQMKNERVVERRKAEVRRKRHKPRPHSVKEHTLTANMFLLCGPASKHSLKLG